MSPETAETERAGAAPRGAGASVRDGGTGTDDDAAPAAARGADDGDRTADDEPGSTGVDAIFSMDGVGKHTMIYGLGVLMSKALSFIMLPIYTRYLTPADYGVMGLIEMTLDVIAIMAGPKIAPAIFRFYHKADSEEERGDVVSTAMIILGISYTMVGATSFLAADLLSYAVFDTYEHGNLVRLASANMIFQSLMIVPLAYARVKDRSVLFVAANAGKLFMMAGLNVFFLVGMGWGVAGIFTSTLITRVLVGALITGWVVRSVGISFSFEKVKTLLRYGLPLVATQAATFLATFSDRFFLEKMGDSDVVGLYNLAYQFGFLLAVVAFTPFDKVWGPKRFAVAERDDSDELLSKGFLYASLLLVTVGLGIVLLVEDVLYFMTDPAFHDAATLVPIILIAYLFQSWAGVHDIGILIRERTEFVTLANWVAAAVALLGYWLLVPRYLGFGAAIATVVAFALRWVLTYVFAQQLWRVEYRWDPVLRLVGIGVVLAVAGLMIDLESVWLSLAARSSLLGVYVVAVWNAGILSAHERRRLLSWTKSMLRKGYRSLRRRIGGGSEASSPAIEGR